MARMQAATLVVGVVIGLALGYGIFGGTPATPPEALNAENTVPTEPAAPPEPIRPVEEPLPDWEATDPPESGAFLWACLAGDQLSSKEAAALREFQPGAVLLRDENIVSRDQVLDLTKSILSVTTKRPPFIVLKATAAGLDRMGAVDAKTAEKLGLLPADRVRELAREWGHALREAGVDAIIGPSLDVYVEGLTQEQLRPNCFGTDATRVSELGVAFVQGMDEAGVIAVVTEYPGLGLAEVTDGARHQIMVSDRNDLAEYISPFDEALSNGAHGMLVGHVELTALDAGIPASHSHVLVESLVRESWEYDGVLVADGILLHPMTSASPPEESAAMALSAGCDAVIVEDTDRRILERICTHLESDVAMAMFPEASRARSRERMAAWRAFLDARVPLPAIAEPAPADEEPAPVADEPARETEAPVVTPAVETTQAPSEADPTPAPAPETVEPPAAGDPTEAEPAQEIATEPPPEAFTPPEPPAVQEEPEPAAADEPPQAPQPEVDAAPEPAQEPLEATAAPNDTPDAPEAAPTPEITEDEPEPEDEETAETPPDAEPAPQESSDDSPEIEATPPPAPSADTPQATAEEPQEEAPEPTDPTDADVAPEPEAAPEPETAPEPAGPPPGTKLVNHRIERGDSLLGLAAHYGVSAADLRAWNGLEDANIKYGYPLKVYVSEDWEPPKAAPEADGPEQTAEPFIIYIVQPGDRLRLIAAKYNSTPSKLVEMNNLKNPDHVWVGQRLKVPAPPEE